MGAYYLLIVDGHESYDDHSFHEYCYYEKKMVVRTYCSYLTWAAFRN